MSRRRTAKLAVSLFGATVVPVVLMSLYLNFSRVHPSFDNALSDYVALVTAVVIGAAFCWSFARLLGLFRSRAAAGWLLVTGYIGVAAAFLFMYGFAYVCGVFRACL
jgi:hypothetical protein